MTEHKRKTKGRRDDDMEQKYSKSVVLYLKIAGILLALLAFIGGINTAYMSSISVTLTKINETVNETRAGMRSNTRDIKYVTAMASENKTDIKTIDGRLTTHVLNDAQGQ